MKETNIYNISPSPSRRPQTAELDARRMRTTHQHLSPEEAQYINHPDEYLHVLDAQGNHLIPVKRGAGSVIDIESLLDAQEKTVLEDSHVSHNHIYGGALSIEDISAAIHHNAKSIKAYGFNSVNRHLFIFKITRNGERWQFNQNSAYNNTNEPVEKTVLDLGDALLKKIQNHLHPFVLFKGFEPDRANFVISVYAAKKIADELDALLEVIVV